MIVFCDGKYCEESEVTISPFDHGFLYGLGAFETFRSYDGVLFNWERHMKRLDNALATLNIQPTYTSEQLQSIVCELERKNRSTNNYFRLNVSAGIAPIGLKTTAYTEPVYIIFVKSLGQMSTYKELEVVETPRNTPEAGLRIKSHNYLNSWFAKQQVSVNSREGLMLTREGYIAETIVGNVFWRKNNVVYTPELSTGILGGTMREWTISQLRAQGCDIEEGHFELEHMKQAEEVWMTNAIQGVVSITELHIKNSTFTYENFHMGETLRKQLMVAIRGASDE